MAIRSFTAVAARDLRRTRRAHRDVAGRTGVNPTAPRSYSRAALTHLISGRSVRGEV
jgi:hypothetical protein